MSAIRFKSFLGNASDAAAQLAALNRSQAVIEFAMDGTILTANENFCAAMGYALAEIRGQHHSLFVDPAERQLPAYKAFWDQLNRGEFFTGQYRRLAKGGREIWIQASYNPVLDAAGKPVKVVKFATDVTAHRLEQADLQGQIAAINKAQAVISFKLDGTIIRANANFLTTLGYTAEEVEGHHHSMFVRPEERESEAYRLFWDKLRQGQYDAGQYHRLGKDGRDVWIQATYNPILDPAGRPFKVVKYATDITAQVKAAERMQTSVDQVMSAVRDKDLTVRVSLEGMTGAFRALCEGVNELLDSQTGIVTAVSAAAGNATSAANSISDGSRDLATRTEQQAASLEETSATTEQLSASVKQSAQHVAKATELGHEARGVAEQGGRVIGEAVEAMARIDKASKSISDIITVIDGIAFQTNLLALNAAVEAARAGDAGRGFAVVASEVRALAQRSAEAAKDIKGLITDSVQQVEGGVSLVRQAGEVLGRVVEAVNRVAHDLAEISSASGEQAKGIEEISLAVSHLDEITQQNSALADESAATAGGLKARVHDLYTLVSAYRTDGAPAPADAPQVAQLRQRAASMAATEARQATPVRAAPAAPVPKQATAAGRSTDWDEF